jgi:hypothetical protein
VLSCFVELISVYEEAKLDQNPRIALEPESV